MIRKLLVLVAILFGISSVIAEIKPGDDSSQLVPELGEPLGKIQVGGKTVYSYPQGVIHVKDGKVIHVSEGFYETLNEFTRKTASGESIALDRTDENLIPDTEEEVAEVPEPLWLTNYYEALEKAGQTHLPLLVLFTESDFGEDSKNLDNILRSEKFEEFAKTRLVLLRIDLPRKNPLPEAEASRNQALVELWEVKKFPTVILINSQAEEYGRTEFKNMGPDAYIEHLQSILAGGIKQNASFSNEVRNLLGDDAADLLDQMEFLNSINGSAAMLSIQLLLGSIMVFYVIRRLMKR